MSALRAGVFMAAFMAAAHAQNQGPGVVIDSHGAVAGVMRRETANLHVHRHASDPSATTIDDPQTKAATEAATQQRPQHNRSGNTTEAKKVEKADHKDKDAEAEKAEHKDKDAEAEKAEHKDKNAETEKAEHKVNSTTTAKPSEESSTTSEDSSVHTTTLGDLTTTTESPVDTVGKSSATGSSGHPVRNDLKYNYVDEQLSAACDSHFEYKGELTNDECAKHCYNTDGCHHFSAGGASCSLGCRISVSNKNAPKGNPANADGQCSVSSEGDASSCNVYRLDFFHALTLTGSCTQETSKLVKNAKSKAACAHACKNTPGCTKFTAEPNCMGGCRISKGSEPCKVETTSGCTLYELF